MRPTSIRLGQCVIQGAKAVGSQALIVGGIGDGLAAAIAGIPTELQGWQCADLLLRAALGVPVMNFEVSFRVVDSSNFQKAWGA
jgi:hypothetical protein